MPWINRPACFVAPDRVASRFLALGKRVVVWRAQAFMVVRTDEQIPIAFMRRAMVNDRGRRYPASLLAPFA
jgi:hypothetical protein